jgi:hypothetical protein
MRSALRMTARDVALCGKLRRFVGEQMIEH